MKVRLCNNNNDETRQDNDGGTYDDLIKKHVRKSRRHIFKNS